MKIIKSITVLIFAFAGMMAFGQSRIGFVNDFASVIPKDAAAKLEAELAEFAAKGTAEIVVVTIPSLGGKTAESYATEIGNSWAVGSRVQNKGVVFLVAPRDNQLWIKTTKESRVILADARAAQIRDAVIVPRSRAKDLPGAIIEGSRAFMRVFEEAKAVQIPVESQARPQTVAPSTTAANKSDGLSSATMIYMVIAFIAVAALIIVVVHMRRVHHRNLIKEECDEIQGRIADLEKRLSNKGVGEGSRLEFRKLKLEFDRLFSRISSTNFESPTAEQELEKIRLKLRPLERKVDEQIAALRRAEVEGERLLSHLPETIASLQERIATGTRSDSSEEDLARARQKLAEAQSWCVGDQLLWNWLIIYPLLTSSHESCAHALSAHNLLNEVHSPRESGPSSQSPVDATVHSYFQPSTPAMQPQIEEVKTPAFEPSVFTPSPDPSPSPSVPDFGGGGGVGGGLT